MKAYHRFADLYPLLAGAEYEALVEDIRRHGLRETILLHRDGSILDGRNRYRACIDAGVRPRYERYDGTDEDALDLVMSKNLHRRDLTSSQRAVIALEFEEVEAELAGKRRLATLKQNATDVQLFAPRGEPGKARDKAAAKAGTNRQYVSDAKKLKQKAPDLFEQVKTGELTIPQAKKKLRRRERVESIRSDTKTPPPAITGLKSRYAIIYADPPWQYDYSPTNSRKVENHYPTMTMDDLCAMNVEQICTDDAILYLWATAPKLPEAFILLDAWGFKYRTNLVWVKDKIGMGYYARGRHELLFVCTRGHPPAPKSEDRPDSVLQAPRTRHSEKPVEAYEIIERCYPLLPKIELFARSARDGWDAWGNEHTRLSGAPGVVTEGIT